MGGLNSHRPRASLLALTLAAVLPGPARASDAVLVYERNTILDQVSRGLRSAYSEPLQEYPYAFSGDLASESRFFADLRRHPPKSVVALGLSAAIAAKKALPEVPLILSGVLQIKRSGLSGGQACGVTMTMPVKEQWAAARRGLPRLKRIGMLYSPAHSGEIAEEAKAAARELDLILIPSETPAKEAIPDALKRLRDRVDAVWIPLDPVVANQAAFEALVRFSVSYKLPLLVPSPSLVEAGGLLAYTPDYAEIGRQLAGALQSVLGGASPKSVGFSHPKRGELTLNLRVARALQLGLPPDFIDSAKKRVE